MRQQQTSLAIQQRKPLDAILRSLFLHICKQKKKRLLPNFAKACASSILKRYASQKMGEPLTYHSVFRQSEIVKEALSARRKLRGISPNASGQRNGGACYRR